MEELTTEDNSETSKIRDKLKEICIKSPKTRQVKAKGPVIAKHNASPFSPSSPRQNKKKTPEIESIDFLAKSPEKITSPRCGTFTQNRSLNQGIHRTRHRSPSFPRSRHASPSPFASQGKHQRRRTPSPGNLFDPQQVEIIQKRLRKIHQVRLYLIRQPGPNSFLVTSDSTENKYKVIIGPQTCTCGKGFHCIHLLFVMVRVLQVKETDSFIWSKTLKNYEVEGLFRRYYQRRRSRVSRTNSRFKNDKVKNNETNFISETESIFSPSSYSYQDEEESLCPICLLEMIDDEALVVCQSGCKNKLHHRCISIWAEECRRQSEPVICPLCRAHWVNTFDLIKKSLTPRITYQSSSSPSKTVSYSPQTSISGPGPPFNSSEKVIDRHLPLPKADPIPDCHRESAKPWIEVFGVDMVSCFYSRDWAVRETAIRRLTREVITALLKDSIQNNCSSLWDHKSPYVDKETLLKCSASILTSVSTDPVYKVYIACLRCLRGLLSYNSCQTSADIAFLQSLIRPILETIILRCADGNKRTSQLSIATILELCRGQSGALAVGSLASATSHLGLGGVDFVLNCALRRSPQQENNWQWLLGRFCLVNRLIEEFTDEFVLQYAPSICSPNKKTSDNSSKRKLMNDERLSSVLKFSLDAVNNSHATVSKMARHVFVQAAKMCSSVPIAFSQIYEMISQLDSSLQVHLKKKVVCAVQSFSNETNSNLSNKVNSSNRRGSVGGDHEKSLLEVTLNENVDSCLINPSAYHRIYRSSSHSPSRVLRKTSNPSVLPPAHTSSSPNNYSSNHVPRIHSKRSHSPSCKPLRRPNHLPLLNKTSSGLLPNKASCTPPERWTKNSKPSPSKHQKQTLIPQSSLERVITSPVASNPSSQPDICNNDLVDVSPCNGWSVSFKKEVHSPNTPSVIPIPSICAASNNHKAAFEQGLNEPNTVNTEILNEQFLQKKLPEIPGLRSEVDDDRAFIIHIQPEIVVVDDGFYKGTYQQNLHWSKGPLLGTGAFSTCFQARDIKSGTLMAVKQASYCRNSEEEQDKVMLSIKDEIMMMAKLDHPNVVRILGATQQGEHFNMFFEWMSGGSVASLLDKYGPFMESVVLNYTSQVLKGLAYLHDNHILHRDLKGANLLVDSTGRHLRIGDFGAAARLASQTTVAGEFQGQLLGTIAFMAPEVLRGEDYGRSCDIWSVGCVVIEMITSKPPWNACDISNHLALIFKIACSLKPPPVPDDISPDLSHFIHQCLTLKSEDRPSAKELMKYKCFDVLV